ncbi:uncharacterized protein LOC141812706 [Curcuma longa]|uniref:uncharacterized protein LOC141812706 n=1 Tax=Curcuma longa TaxID=136217 RepID=UPI003D9E9563
MGWIYMWHVGPESVSSLVAGRCVAILAQTLPRYHVAPEACVWLAAGGGDAPLETHVGPYAAAHRTVTVHRVVKMDERDLSPFAPSCVGCAFQFGSKSVIRADDEVEPPEEEQEEEESSEIELGKRIEKRQKAAPPSALRWVELLLVGEFFGSCEEHKEDRKSEENIFCVDCGRRMCPHCLAGGHRDHRLLQIRRYVYQDVVRVHDMANLLDCSKVQPYIVNSAKVVLLKPRRQSKPLKTNTGGPACKICRRSISESHCYCSVTCLVSDVDSAVTVKEPTPVGCQSEPLLADRTASSEEQPSPSHAASPPPSDEGQEDAGRSIPEPSVRRVHRRKGFPRRAPF